MNATERILRHASQLGFDDCAVARCHPLNSQRDAFEEWLEHGYDGSLSYLRRHVAKRFDPSLLVEGARSVIVCAVSYHRPLSEGDIPSRIASYAHSRDYHLTLREKLAELLVLVRELYPDSEGRAFTDTAPIVEKAWAAEAGLGWIGRNSLLIHPRLGSFVLLGEIVTTAELDAGRPTVPDGCGNCHRCIDACPAGAILPGRRIDASRCISRRTIERGEGDEGELHGWIFGCDLCQRACPHNRRAPIASNKAFRPVPELERMNAEQWLALNRAQFDRLFSQTPLARCGLQKLQDRIRKLGKE